MASSLVFLRFLMARLLLWMLLSQAKEAAVSNNNNNNCRLFLNKSSPWAQCQCLQDGLGDPETVRLSCADVDWERMPDVRTLWEEPTRKEGGGQLRLEQQQSQMSRPSLSALCIRNGRIRSLEQDAFRTEAAIQSLELSLNAIESVNANAFRGLEGQLTQLDLSANRLTLIPGWALTYLRQLQKLQLEDNRIARIVPDSFGETHLANLRYVHLERNRIETLENGSLTRLPAQVLMLAGNRIKKLESGSLPQAVWFLDLKDNLLENIPFAALDGLGQLKVLDLERNNISELAAPDPPLLETAELDLKLAHNRIRVLAEGALDGFRRFARLDLSHNQIGSISEKAFRSVQTLSSLDLGANSLVQIPQNTLLRFANSLLLLNLNNNNLAQLPDALGPLLGLRQLNLDGNQLKVLDESLLKGIKANLSELSVARNGLEKVPSQALQGMTSLRSLDLSRNEIVRLGKMAFGSSNGLGTNGVSALQRLSLAGNRIRELTEPGTFLYLGQLTHLDLSHNQIQRVSKATLERLESLESLSLDHNEMLEFPRNALSSLAHLRQLSMEANRLAMLPNYAFQWLVHLQKLNLASNRLHTLNAKTFHSTSAIQIKWLSLAKNRISRMETAAFQNLPNLEQLFLHFNQLKVLQTQIISSLKNLRHLTLAHNQINETQENAFANLPQLQSLSLAHNRLRTIKEGVFHKVSALAILDLSYNRIEAFDLDFMGASAHQIRVLDISHNVIRKLQVQPSMGSLRVLHLQQNQLEFVDGQMLRGFEQLRSVDLSQNDLIELSEGALVGSIRLERIILADNNLRHIWKDSFRDQLLIRLLDLSGNVLHSLEPGVFGQNNLLELDLSRNNFSAIPIRALDSVRQCLCQLKMTRNGLTRLDRRDFEGLSNLSRLELAENRIESLEEEVFSLLPRLKWLDLSGNPVSSWSPHVFLGLSHSLTHLDISRCSLFSLPRLKAPSLLSLNVSGNFLYELSATDLDPSPGLISLDLSRNRLGELRAQLLERMPELRVLNISDNGISSLGEEQFRALGQLEVLSLARLPSLVRLPLAPAWALLNRLRSLELHSLGGLVQLLDMGPILHFLPPLHSLHFECRHEIFTGSELAKADLRLLRHLTISGHSIRHLDPNSFARLRGFRLELTLAGTQLRHFPPEALANLQGVAFLRLSLPNNRIQWLAPFWQGGQRAPALNQRGTMLESLDLRGNPLECDCRMRWLAAWLARTELPEAELLRVSQCSVARGKQPSGRAGTGSLNLLDWAQRLEEEEADDLDGCGPAGQLQRDGASRVHKSATFLPLIGVLLVADWLRRWRLSRTMR